MLFLRSEGKFISSLISTRINLFQAITMYSYSQLYRRKIGHEADAVIISLSLEHFVKEPFCHAPVSPLLQRHCGRLDAEMIHQQFQSDECNKAHILALTCTPQNHILNFTSPATRILSVHLGRVAFPLVQGD